MGQLSHPRIWLALLFLSALIIAAYLQYIAIWAPAPYLVVSLLTLMTYAHDKRMAQKKTGRISEFNLHLLAAFGGWPGALIGQQTLRHKTRKKAFQVVSATIVIVHLLAWSFVAFARVKSLAF
jgi:uncharacterized membrane protein YsdA (DUF1294 family)